MTVAFRPYWYLTKDGDKSCLAMYERHYSAYHYKDGRVRNCFVVPEKRSFCALVLAMRVLFGGNLLTNQDNRELIALLSGPKAASDHQSLSDRLTPSMIASGLISGITSMSIEKNRSINLEFRFSGYGMTPG